ncbi:MAG: hypothetical protein GYA59_08700 [Chloroflexi bacterium]|nr:hypothetical protein [Chloroflexota bacterium]
MTTIRNLILFGAYFFLVIPAIIVMLGAWLVRDGEQETVTHTKLRLLAFAPVLALAILDVLLWANPYGRSISSSLPALGMMPVVVALLVLVVKNFSKIAGLWPTDDVFLAVLALASLILLGLLWVGEAQTFYAVVVLAAVSTLAWWVGERSGLLFLTILCLVCVGLVVFINGGVFSVPGLDDWGEWQTVLMIGTSILALLAILLGAALVYAGLRGEAPLNWKDLGGRLGLAALLVGSSAYMVFWDGIWSAVRARAFEDHLPFTSFLLSLIAGVLLTASLRGWRRLAGPLYVVVVTAVATLALVWGWHVSAFTLTERRAVRLEQAVTRFQQENGHYPASLGELTPRYLLYLPPPVVTRQGGWCYQGGDDYFRLGYVSGTFTYFRADYRAQVYAQRGELPQEPWNCDRLVAQFEAGELY